MKKLISIGIPVRNEEENIPFLINRIEKILPKLAKKGYNVEILVNNNASGDQSLALLLQWAEKNSCVKVFHFNSIVTFQASILQLMKNSKGEAFIVLQSDLQDPPEMIINFIEVWEKKNLSVAGVIEKRNEGIFSRLTRKLFYILLEKFSDGKVIQGFQDFYLLPKNIYTQLSQLSPEGLFLRGHISSRFGDVERIKYVRKDRERGQSNFDFPKKYTLALDGILLFGTRFIRVIAVVSLGVFLMGLICALMLTGSYIVGYRSPTAGWTSLGLVLTILLSLFGMSTSLILEYLIRIYRQMLLKNTEIKPIKLRK